MYDELTQVDIDKMKEEIAYRKTVLRPKLIEDVQTARGFGDLSENFEYKCAKRDKNRNDSRIRGDGIGLFDKVTMFNEKLQKEQTIQLVTTLRQNPLKGLISKESPVGKALLGRKAGERVEITVSPEMKYTVEIRTVEKGEDDASMDISAY